MRFVTALALFFLLNPAVTSGQNGSVSNEGAAGSRPEPSLKGTAESLMWQNFKLISLEGLSHIQDDEDLQSRIQSGSLVPIEPDECLVFEEKLDSKWRFALPRVISFLREFSRAVCDQFGMPVQVNSAVRHVPRQRQLIRGGNANAAPIDGERASPHLTGATVDLEIKDMLPPVRAWMESRLLELEKKGYIDATLEKRAQLVLHVTVFSEYIEHH